jgi:hypothetical protein
MAFEVRVLHAQAQAFHQAHPGAVQQAGHEGVLAFQQGQDAGDLFPGEHRRDPAGGGGPLDALEPRQLQAQHLAIQKEQGAQCLIVRGG